MAIATPPFRIHRLDCGTPTSVIEPVLRLSNLIFDTRSLSPTHHSSLEEWSLRLNKANSILVYGTLDGHNPSAPSLTPPSTSTDPSPGILGFIFAHMKADSALPHPTLHVWLAGVSESARGTGIFAALMSEVEGHARSLDVAALSVATFPAKFEKMYAILQKQGWKAREWTESGRKVLMTKTL